MIRIVMIVAIAATMLIPAEVAMADNISLKLQSIEKDPAAPEKSRKVIKEETWGLSQTAVIVCDVWDYHHCLNAVRRLEEFAPRLNQVLKAARDRGAIVIHAPSDCMAAYADHPARQRAIQTPLVSALPNGIQSWCSRLDQEGRNYPIDQSDGGEDDDPKEHAEWAAKLTAMGRNPGMPWKKQSDLITIDASHDYISDRGDEVWNILERHAIRNVILTGVHLNMCVLGRPFGLRQMVRNGKHVALMRDMTDSMYSPKSWPYVDHFTGHDLVIAYVEEQVCPTITSDQFLGGKPFRWKSDQRPDLTAGSLPSKSGKPDLNQRWTTVDVRSPSFQHALKDQTGAVWLRGAVVLPAVDQTLSEMGINLPHGPTQLWLNGYVVQPQVLGDSNQARFILPTKHITPSDYNLIVVRTTQSAVASWRGEVFLDEYRWEIEPHWQVRLGDDVEFTSIPLPAKFGIGPDGVLSLSKPRAKN